MVPCPVNKSPLTRGKSPKIVWTKSELNKLLFTKYSIELVLNWTNIRLHKFKLNKWLIEQISFEHYSLS